MNDDRYERTIDELETHACKWWPKEVRDEAQKISILQTLLDTQEKFISILKLAKKEDKNSIFNLLDAAGFSYNLFLKHLAILVDVGAEPLKRINANFGSLFYNGVLTYDVGNGKEEYKFVKLPIKGELSNERMKIDSVENLTSNDADIALCKDVIMILVYGAASVKASTRAILYKCTPYEYLGKDDVIDEFVRQNYIRVSRILGGKTANDLGNGAQQYVVKYLQKKLGANYNIKSNGTIPGITQNDGLTLTSFDIVVDRIDDTGRRKKYVAVEITFQETSNSTIERKGGQARDRFEKISANRHFIAYIIDGAGNFSRRSATTDMCENSHCTVAYTPEEFELLVEFIKEKIG